MSDSHLYPPKSISSEEAYRKGSRSSLLLNRIGYEYKIQILIITKGKQKVDDQIAKNHGQAKLNSHFEGIRVSHSSTKLDSVALLKSQRGT